MTSRKDQLSLAQKPDSFEQIKKNARAQLLLGTQENVLVTHEHLKQLRQCAEHMQQAGGDKLYIIGSRNNPQVKFLVKTLIHLGVSCGQIHCLIEAQQQSNIEIVIAP